MKNSFFSAPVRSLFFLLFLSIFSLSAHVAFAHDSIGEHPEEAKPKVTLFSRVSGYLEDLANKIRPANLLSSVVQAFNFFPSLSATPTPSVRVAPIETNLPDSLVLLIEKVRVANTKIEQLGKNPKDSFLAISIAKQRKADMKSIAVKDTKIFLGLTFNSKIRTELIPEVQQYVEKRGVMTGKLEVKHIDDFKNHEHSRFDYALNVTGNKYALLSPTELAPINGGSVKVDGWTLDNLIVLNNGDSSLIPVAGQEGSPALGNQRLLALITEMQGDDSPVTVSQVENILFTSTSPFFTYFKNQSYGKTWFTGKVYKIKLDRPIGPGCNSGVDIQNDDVLLAIKNQNINLENFDRVLFIPPVGYCSVVGKSDYYMDNKILPLSQSWVSWYSFIDPTKFDTTLAHELGHALGVMHANFLLCEENNSCGHVEYGNYFDVMGHGVGDFNALYKEQLNWLTANDFLYITKAGSYSIGTLEDKSGIRAAKIVNPFIGPTSVMYLEKRVSTTVPWLEDEEEKKIFSNQKNGLMLNIPEQPLQLKTTSPQLIDMSSGILGGYSGADIALFPTAKSYIQKNAGISIGSVAFAPVESGKNPLINFHIDMTKPDCYSNPPTLYPQGNWNKVAQGAVFSFGTTLKNMDSSFCSLPSDFSIQVTQFPPGVTLDSTNATKVTPGDFSYLFAFINISTSTPVDFYNLQYKINNLTSGKSSNGSIWMEVIPQPQILSIDKTIVQPGDSIKITTNYNEEGYVSIIASGGNSSFELFSGYMSRKNAIETTIPSGLEYCFDENKDNCIHLGAPRGKYDITLHAFGAVSLPVPIIIGSEVNPPISNPVITVDENPTLVLSYDTSKKESALTANFPISITSAESNLGFVDLYSIFTNKNPNSIPKLIPDPEVRIEADTSNLPAVRDEHGMFVIPKGRTIKFNVRAVINPKIIAPGPYTASLSELYFITDANADKILVSVPRNETNIVTVIGETSPYVKEVNPVKTVCGEVITIKGIRFHPLTNTLVFSSSNSGEIVSQFHSIESKENGTIITFVPSLVGGIKTGEYSLSVINSSLGKIAGQSNSISLEITNKTGKIPCPTFITPPSPSRSVVPSPGTNPTNGVPTVSKINSASNSLSNTFFVGDRITVTGKNFGAAPSIRIGNVNVAASVDKAGENITFTIPSLSPGNYYLYVGNSGAQSDGVYIKILSKTSGSSSASGNSGTSPSVTVTSLPSPSPSSSASPSSSPTSRAPSISIFANILEAVRGLIR